MSIKRYDHKTSEKKWQKVWKEKKLYEALDLGKNKKYYALVEFPYPSGAGLHVGHVRSWAAMDAYSRRKRMQGFNVLYPMGWDSFGLPAENYAIKTGIHPSITVKENIDNFRRQCNSLGLSFDWSKEIDTTDSKYYKWTQWIFIQMFKRGLAYRKEVPVNWCGFCKTNLADEEVTSEGKHERCGNPTEKRKQNQWLLRITKYADRLLSDLSEIDFSPRIRIQQENWIGRKEWTDIKYKVDRMSEEIIVSTTRPDTNFGATFVVMSPEHPFVEKILNGEIPVDKTIKDNISKYVTISKSKSDMERIAESMKKTGVFTQMYAINGLNGYKMPIYITDFVLMSVGTGAVVGVPGHDLRDFQFAQEFNIPVIRVIVGSDGKRTEIEKTEDVYEGEGTLINSDFLNGMDVPQATNKVISYLENKGIGKRTVRYHIHDWIFSRQHYWGEPIPMVYCDTCAKVSKSWFSENTTDEKSVDWAADGWYPVLEEDLPVELPFMEKYQPSGTGESPLANNSGFTKTKCPKCGNEARRETDTMPNWAGSNWYYLGYLVSKTLENQKSKTTSNKFQNIFDLSRENINYWMPVDLYQGGYEHTTLHLLYSRFIYKFLFDIGLVPAKEPYTKRRSHGIVLGADGRKMSKSFGNVINPDEIVEKFGADTLRLYEMFMGPFDQAVAWSDESVEGCYRFLGRIWRLFNENVTIEPTDKDLLRKFHQTIKKIDSDIEDMKFNTAVSSLMEFSNFWNASGHLNIEEAKVFCRLIAPFTPHFAEEIWLMLSGKNEAGKSVHSQDWPAYDQDLTVDEVVTIPIQVNGKLRTTITVEKGKENDKEYISETAKNDNNITKWIIGKSIKKEIYIPGKLLNIVV